jgi:uncharacterized membrane protein HdeD (DUF308 family)
MLTPEERRFALSVTRMWWLEFLIGTLFLILGFIVLSYDAQSLTTVSVLLGISFLFTGFAWVVIGASQRDMRWWFLIGGALALVAGIVAFAYPDETITVLGLLLGWFLLVAGLIDIVVSLMNREVEHWWFGLIQGLIMLVLGVWAVGEDDRSVFLVLTLAGLYLVIRGIGAIIGAFMLRKVRKELQAT